MASIQFKFEDEGDTWEEHLEEYPCEPVIRDFLQPDTKLSLQSVALEMRKISSAKASGSGHPLDRFNETAVLLAEQVPYDHPSSWKLVELIKTVYDGAEDIPEHVGAQNPRSRYGNLDQQLGEESRGKTCVRCSIHVLTVCRRLAHSPPESREPCSRTRGLPYVHERLCLRRSCEPPRLHRRTISVLMRMQDAFENDLRDKSPEFPNAYVMAAAQWILIYGEVLFELLHSPPTEVEKRMCPPRHKSGILARLLSKGQKRLLTLQRWHNWRDGFWAVAAGERDNKDVTYVKECKDLAASAAERMQELESQDESHPTSSSSSTAEILKGMDMSEVKVGRYRRSFGQAFLF